MKFILAKLVYGICRLIGALAVALAKVAWTCLPFVLFFAAISLATRLIFGIVVWPIAAICTLLLAADQLKGGRLL